MDMSVNRVHILVHRLRDRIREMATLQRRIHYDMNVFVEDGDDVRSKFEETREKYLDLLGVSLPELRKIMSTSDLTIPTLEFCAEDVMKRVRPVTEKYLRRLVKGGIISENDMECILVGGYDYVEDFFYDLDNNVGMFGLKESTESSEDVSGQEPDVAESDGGYDDNGFFVLDERNANENADETDHSTTAQPEPSTITPPVVLLPPSGSFSWAEDVEEELESLEPVKQLDHGSLTVTTLPVEEEQRSPVDASFPSDSSDTDSDISSDFDVDTSQPELVNSSLTEPQNSDPEQEKKDDAESSVAQESDSKVPDTDTSDQTEQPIPAVFATYRSLSQQTDGDEILDEWLEDQEMWFWQYEALFLMTLAAKRYKRLFEEARGAYKADPFNDD